MNVLLVTPVEVGSGETVTARYLAALLARSGHRVHFLASAFASRFLHDQFAGQISALGQEGPANVKTWSRTLEEFRPDIIVFADYPLMFWRKGLAPLAREPGWEKNLLELDVPLVTLDHFGFAQGEMGIFLGPPHLTHEYHRFEALPERMQIMLPCPMHAPGAVAGRKGTPFRYWDMPLTIAPEVRAATRSKFLRHPDDLLVVHIVSNWAWQSAENLKLTFYRYLGDLLLHYLAQLGRGVTVVSLNNGSLLGSASRNGVHLTDIRPVTPPEFDELMFSSDLMLTENKVSISMGKAVCGLQAAALLKNSYGVLDLMGLCSGPVWEIVSAMERDRLGSVFPFDVYPTGMKDTLESIVLYRDNPLTEGFVELEVFGGAPTESALARLLTDAAARADLRQKQQRYVDALTALDDGATVLERIAAEAAGERGGGGA
jgi:hypothetical protein